MMEALVAEEPCAIDLTALRSRCLGNLDLVNRVLGKFAVQLNCDLHELEQVLSNNDVDAFALLAHRIKGMAANVEAKGLYAQATAAEQSALAHTTHELPGYILLMREEAKRITESLSRMASKAK